MDERQHFTKYDSMPQIIKAELQNLNQKLVEQNWYGAVLAIKVLLGGWKINTQFSEDK